YFIKKTHPHAGETLEKTGGKEERTEMELTYKIFTDTTTDLTPEWMTENNVGWLEHGIVIDGKEIKDDFGKTVPHKEFYQRLRGGLMPTTTQVDIPTFTNAYEQALQ